ncbi:MAG: TlyA family RNA methyltransferase [Acidobacteria bacterium]|nr:TlyA family RNA methyltransferase [Acidobacteriota bacterium]
MAVDEGEARALIMAGQVVVGEHRKSKPQEPVDCALEIRLKDQKKTVGRGHSKLAGFLADFPLPIKGKVCLDLGASTGGFTQVLLEQGAQRVYAVDVGTNQLDWRLRSDPRVISLEQTHAKLLNPERVPEKIELATVDVSFTALHQVLGFLFPLMELEGILICLLKPQFECPREAIEPGGLVRDPQAIQQSRQNFETWARENGLGLLLSRPSMLKGRTGNQEFFYALKKIKSADLSY